MNNNDFTYDWKEVTSIAAASIVLTTLIYVFSNLY